MLPLSRDIVKLRVDRDIWEDVLKNAKIDEKKKHESFVEYLETKPETR